VLIKVHDNIMLTRLPRPCIAPHLQGNIGLRFQHPAPVQPGVLGNIGWREEENLARQGQEAAAAAPAAADVVAPAKAAAADGSLSMYTMEEVEQHATEESAWFVHEGKVGASGCGCD
jgi:nitrate reductase (NAD(P)H)